MRPAMRDTEIALFASVLRCADTYVEFGAGGSSVLAASLVRRSVVCIDSSQAWLDKVSSACVGDDGVRPVTLLADIGPVRALGYPDGLGHRNLWPNYHTGIWERHALADAEVYLIDGRFRVACFLQTVLRCAGQALILFHDFTSRRQYHIVRAFAREVARTDELSLFQRHAQFDVAAAQACLRNHALDPN